MRKSQVVAGLDVGTSKVCCLVGEVGQDDHLEIVGKGVVPSTGLKKGVVVDVRETVRNIQQAVKDAERMAGYRVNQVYLGVTGEHISSINSHGMIAVANQVKEITNEDVNRVIDAAKIVSIPSDREVIHVIPRGFTIDGQNGVRNPVGMSGMRLEVETHIVTGVVTFLQNAQKCVHLAGLELEPNGVVLQPLASSLSVLNDAEKELGILLLDLGGGTTDLAIFKNGSICHTTVLPLGGNHVTYDIAVAFRLPMQEAERVKVEYGSALSETIGEEEVVEVTTLSGSREPISRKKLVETITPRIEEIFTFVKEEVERVMPYPGGVPRCVAGITLTGGASLLPGIQEVAQRILSVPVRIGGPSCLNGTTVELGSPPYSTGVGLILYGAKARQERRYRGGDGLMAKLFLGKLRGWFRDFF